MDFPGRKNRGVRREKASSFWTKAKGEYADLFASFVEQAGEFRDPAEFANALRDASWELTEKIAKRSWRNGVETGQARARS